MIHFRTAVLTVCVLCAVKTVCAFDLTLVHTNDVHARFEEASASGGSCKKTDKTAGKCYGGVARRLTKIRELNSTYPNMILLDAGDQYQGTLWFNVFKGQAASHFMNVLGYQAMALGNHEFDNGVSGLLPLLNNATFPIMSANIDASKEPSVDGKIKASTVLTVGGERIGVVGYTTPETPIIATTGKLIFKDEIQAIQPIVNQMKKDGINKIIALGHSGYSRDIEIAKNTKDIDIVVGGHSHTFLYTGTPPTDDEVIGPYPTVEENLDGDKVLVVQDFFFGKFLGFLQVTFSDEGKVTAWQGQPILMNSSVAQDTSVLADVDYWRKEVTNISRVPVGNSLVKLEGIRTVCRIQECNMGNLITDGMIWQLSQSRAPNGTWITASIALMNSGGIRTSIEQGSVTMEDVLTVLPFQNYLDIVAISGRVLIKALEHAVSKYNAKAPPGEFLQVSGLQIEYDLSKPSGSRLVSARALCQHCDIPTYNPVNPDEKYSVVLPNFVANGGDGFDFELHPEDRLSPGYLDSDVFNNFLKLHDPVYSAVEGRIQFVHTVSAASNLNLSSLIIAGLLCLVRLFA